VESLNLDINIQPHYFPLIGGFMARRFEPSEEGELGWYPAGFGSYAWGGEQLKITQLSVPENMHSEELTLEALDTNGFILRDPDGEVVVQGPVGEEMVMGDYSITVSELVARPGTTFSVIKSRTYNTTEDYQNRLAAGERGKQSGIINVTLEDPDPAKAILVLEEVAQRYVDQNVARNAAEATKSLEFLSEQVPAVRKKLDAAQTAFGHRRHHRRDAVGARSHRRPGKADLRAEPQAHRNGTALHPPASQLPGADQPDQSVAGPEGRAGEADRHPPLHPAGTAASDA